jgi:hypothetical protein
MDATKHALHEWRDQMAWMCYGRVGSLCRLHGVITAGSAPRARDACRKLLRSIARRTGAPAGLARQQAMHRQRSACHAQLRRSRSNSVSYSEMA